MALVPIHPGEHLAEELKELGLSAAELSRQLDVPVLIFSAPEDHVVPPEHSAHLRDTAGGGVEFVTLERSYHVATVDYDGPALARAAADFLGRR